MRKDLRFFLITFLGILIAAGVVAQSQAPQVSGVVNSVSNDSRLSPGSLASIFGTNLVSAAPTTPPVSVTVNGSAAAVVYSSATQLQVQLPVGAITGSNSLQVNTVAGSSLPRAISLDAYAPAIFTQNNSGSGDGLFLNSSSGIVTGTVPARPLELITLYAAGLGATNPPVATGAAAPANANTVTVPEVRIEGTPAGVVYSRLAPGLVGAYQVAFAMPYGLAAGRHSVTLSIGGFTSNVVTIPVAPTGDLREKIGGVDYLGTWFLDSNGTGSFDNGVDPYFNWWAGAGSVAVKGDWNGNGRTKAGFFKNGLWYLDYNGNGILEGSSVDRLYSLGWAAQGLMPLTGDWNGDGRTKIGIFYNGFWYLDYNGNGVWDGPVIDRLYGWGWNGVTPVTGDWNGDGRTKIGFFINGFWYLDYDGNGVWEPASDRQYSWGWSAVTPLVGDWNGDGKTKIGFFVNGFWYLDYNGNGIWEPASDRLYGWGWEGVVPVVGDWNGDGRAKVGFTVNSFWYLDYNGSGVWDGPGVDRFCGFGHQVPLVGRW